MCLETIPSHDANMECEPLVGRELGIWMRLLKGMMAWKVEDSISAREARKLLEEV